MSTNTVSLNSLSVSVDFTFMSAKYTTLQNNIDNE